DFVELPLDFRILHSQDAAVEVNILAPCQVWMKSGRHLDQGTETAIDLYRSRVWTKDARQDLEEGALARSVRANDAHDFAASELKVNVLQCPEFVFAETLLPRAMADQAARQRRHQIPQRVMDLAPMELFPQVINLNSGVAHRA